MQVDAQPYPFDFDPATTALVVIDMQRDFVEPGGFGETLGNDVVAAAVASSPPLRRCSTPPARSGLTVIHTREGHGPTCRTARPPSSPAAIRPCASATPARWAASWSAASTATTSSTTWRPSPGELVIDKPGKGAFYGTTFGAELAARGHHQPRGHRRHHRGVRADHRPRGQRPRLRVPGALGLHRLLLPRVPAGRPGHDRRAGRHLRLGRAVGSVPGRASSPQEVAS